MASTHGIRFGGTSGLGIMPGRNDMNAAHRFRSTYAWCSKRMSRSVRCSTHKTHVEIRRRLSLPPLLYGEGGGRKAHACATDVGHQHLLGPARAALTACAYTGQRPRRWWCPRQRRRRRLGLRRHAVVCLFGQGGRQATPHSKMTTNKVHVK